LFDPGDSLSGRRIVGWFQQRRLEAMRPKATSTLPRSAPPTIDLAEVPVSIRKRLVEGWKHLCEDERDSVIAATLVAADLARLGAPPPILGEVARVIEDEIRHVNVCTSVLERLQAAPEEVPAERRRADLGVGPSLENRIARTLIAGFAVGEPMSAGCFAASRASCREPLIRWALTELLRDEARHGPFGISAGGWVIRHWTDEERRALWPECVTEMEAFERRLGGPVATDDRGHHEPAAAAFGMLTPAENCAAAVTAAERWVIPPLTRLGIVARALD
jgi:hypothetical protein